MQKIIIDKQIARYRKKAGLTQEQLAASLNVSNQAVSKWESSQCCPDISLLPEIAEFFNITVDELLGVATVKNNNAVLLAEHIIEMSISAYDNGLLSLIEYVKQTACFPFLKTAIDILICGECRYETAEEILRAASGDDRLSQLVVDCTAVLMKGVHPASIVQILENRLSPRELASLKLKRPDFFPISENYCTSS
ncbi:MAG: helix-turn-helix domain-containing protein [Ruminiclostridium sp.]|nr:helix-turn-helix domain-containing protein [Ruminiclostridium sp.]